MLPSTYSVELSEIADGNDWRNRASVEEQAKFMARLAKYKPSCSDCGSTAKHHKPGTPSCKRAALMRAVRHCTAHSHGSSFESWQRVEYEAQIKRQRGEDDVQLAA